MTSTFHSFMLLPQQQSSPQAIGSSIPRLGQQHSRQQQETPVHAPSASSEVTRLTNEYQAEGMPWRGHLRERHATSLFRFAACSCQLPISHPHLASLGQCCCHVAVQFAAERLAEHLDLCGIQKEALSSKARLSLQRLASIASKLQLAEARPELVLAAWAALLVKESKAAAMLVSLLT